ncbi:MAG: helix-turn-helix domain-containing protein [Beijerinckiaceae bacterium]
MDQNAGEEVYLHSEPKSGLATVVFDHHRFCAGRSLDVQVMKTTHRHSQFEVNLVLQGGMTYWFDGREVELQPGRFAMFWGLIPHRSTACVPGTKFVCLYVPMATFMRFSLSDKLRRALFAGALVEAEIVQPSDSTVFRGWHSDLLGGDANMEGIVRDELGARLRRLDRDGWRDMRKMAQPAAPGRYAEALRAGAIEAMVRFIGEKAGKPITVSDIANAADLHPNYAMALFKRTLGETMGAYLTRYRLDTVQAQLLSTDNEIAGIAFAAGFNSLSRFYEAFQRRFGISPAKFRHLQRG